MTTVSVIYVWFYTLNCLQKQIRNTDLMIHLKEVSTSDVCKSDSAASSELRCHWCNMELPAAYGTTDVTLWKWLRKFQLICGRIVARKISFLFNIAMTTAMTENYAYLKCGNKISFLTEYNAQNVNQSGKQNWNSLMLSSNLGDRWMFNVCCQLHDYNLIWLLLMEVISIFFIAFSDQWNCAHNYEAVGWRSSYCRRTFRIFPESTSKLLFRFVNQCSFCTSHSICPVSDFRIIMMRFVKLDIWY